MGKIKIESESSDDNQRTPALRFLEVYKEALKMGLTGKLTGWELRSLEKEFETAKVDPALAKEMAAKREGRKAKERADLKAYHDNLESRVKKMMK